MPDNGRGWKIIRKNEQLAEKTVKLRGQPWNFLDNFLAKGIILRYTSKPGFIHLISLWLIFTTHFCLAKEEKSHWWSCRDCVTSFVISLSLASTIFFLFHEWKIKKIYPNFHLFVCFVVTETKSEEEYQIGQRGFHLMPAFRICSTWCVSKRYARPKQFTGGLWLLLQAARYLRTQKSFLLARKSTSSIVSGLYLLPFKRLFSVYLVVFYLATPLLRP